MQTRLEEMARTVKMQEVMHRRGLTSANLLSPDVVDQMFRYQDRMQTYLAPFLHRDRQGLPSFHAKHHALFFAIMLTDVRRGVPQ